MKKFLYLAAATTLLFGSCSDDFSNKMTTSKEYQSKVIAAYGVGTRTSINTEDGKYTYSWSPTDQLGVYEAEGGDANAPFEYLNDNTFVGQYSLPTGVNYVGYYPYDAKQTYTGGALTLYIQGIQNYNAKKNTVANGNLATGSFATNAAPGVGMGTVNTQDELNMKFEAIGSYITIPVVGYSTITEAVLTINNGGDLQLNGSVSVNVEDFLDYVDGLKGEPNGVQTDIQGYDFTANSDGTSITLKCGSGVQLDETTPTYFWFVIPAGLDLSNAAGKTTISLELTSTEGENTVSREFDGDFEWPWGNSYTQLNYVLKVTDSGSPFYYTPEGVAQIATAPQFLEYINLVTIGAEDAITQYNDMLTNNPSQAAKSYLPYFVSSVENASTATVNGAQILKSISFSQKEIEDYIGEGDGLVTSDLDPYFNFLQNYVDKGSVPQIGGKAAYTMTGIALPQTSATAPATEDDDNTVVPVYPTISNLKVIGNGMFNYATGASSEKPYVGIYNLNFDEIIVDASEENAPYNFLSTTGNGSYLTFKGVGVSNSCSITPAAEEGAKYALFNNLTSVGFNNARVNNDSGMLYAYTLQVNTFPTGFDFTSVEGATVEDFNTIQITANGANSILYINEEDVDTLLGTEGKSGNAVNNTDGDEFAYNGYPFSVVSLSENEEGEMVPNTSYWTGTVLTDFNSSDNVTTAEQLAYLVQDGYSDSKWAFSLANNIDLRNLSWWVNPSATVGKIAVVYGGNNTISNVNIDGLKVDGTAANSSYMTLFGPGSEIYNLTVSNITIDNSGENAVANAQVAALSWYPAGPIENVTVNGLTVSASKAAGPQNVKDVNGAVGGLFSSMDQIQFLNVKSAKVSDFDFTGVEEGIVGGYLSGYVLFETNGTSANITNNVNVISDVNANPFGYISVTILPNPGGTTLTVKGFPANYFGNQESNVFVAGANTPNNSQLKVVDVTNNTTTYFYYSEEKGYYVYDNQVQGTAESEE